MRFIHSVSFKKSEKKLIIFALSHNGFSEYIKNLIKEDMKRNEKVFTDEERAEIERIIEVKFKEIMIVSDQTED
ncbi:hypothetical protein KQH81_04510 [Clostridium cadaveris]|uniref:hypothetical protein n=1 Tax=Clostridium cadaveris TaxID=1529 RepID=UPI001E63938D|nr:hypothetical protein [Clostridium cadaveris]UFH65805.1 hypothetical protein KQH81_04510 [Clostridium cadaveris]